MLNILKDKDNSKLTKEDIFIFLSSYLKEQITLSQRVTMNEEAFSKPSWSEFQAYQIGLQKAYTKVLELIPDQGKK